MENLYLQHHGILGMKWGVRRFQNKDGSLTPAGKKRYRINEDNLKTWSSDEQISRDILKDKIREEVRVDPTDYWDKKDLSEPAHEVIDDYKNEYIHDIEHQLPEHLGKIDRYALLNNLADKQVDRIFSSAVHAERTSQYYSENKERLLNNARNKDRFDMEFLEINGDIDKHGEPLKGEELMKAYENYIDDMIKSGYPSKERYS